MDFDPRSDSDSFTLSVSQALATILTDRSISLKSSNRILVAFSGGPDSTALLEALLPFAKSNSVELHACHINHGLRGEESDGDEEFCKQLCQSKNIPLHTEKLNGCGRSEAELRAARYESIKRIAELNSSGICLTGHTLDDQIETMLFRLFRGTGPAGLLGIPNFRRLSDKLVLLRPMLALSRTDCTSYLDRQRIVARKDSSNEDECYSRNYIRNRILPLIESRFGGFNQHMEQLRKVIEADESLLSGLSQNATIELNESSTGNNLWLVDKFNELPLSLRRRVLHDGLKERRIEGDFAKIESMLEMIDLDGSGAMTLNEHWQIRLFQGEIQWQSSLDKPKEEEVEDFTVDVRLEGMTFIHRLGLVLKMERVDKSVDSLSFPGSQEHELIGDLSSAGDIKIRLREAGDQIQPLGMSCMVRLKKFLHTHKSTKTLSFGGRVLLLANENEVLWVPGCGMSQRIAIGKKATHRISLMRISPDEGSVC